MSSTRSDFLKPAAGDVVILLPGIMGSSQAGHSLQVRAALEAPSPVRLPLIARRTNPAPFNHVAGGTERPATRGRCLAVLIGTLTASLGVLSPLLAVAAPPKQTQQFVSSSRRTMILYYDYDSGPCGAGTPCDFRGVLPVRPGFEQAEVFLSGFRFETAKQPDAIKQVAVTARKYRYDSTTGELDMGVNSMLRTRGAQPFSYHVSFVVVLTAPGVVQYTSVSTGCAGVARCHIARTLAGAVPNGMHYIGLATSQWHLGVEGAPVLLNTLSGHIDSLTVTPGSVNLDYLCVMHGRRPINRMFCEWGAKVIAFDPAEMAPSNSPLFPQYTVLSWNTPARASLANQATVPNHQPIAGFLDAFEGLTLTYQTFPYTTPVQHPVWLIESTAQGFTIHPSFPDTAQSEYGIFLGTTFGNTTSAQNYAYQLSRAFGFLR